MRVIIYAEGGGDSAQLKTDCRKAFSTFLSRAGLKGSMPKIVACGGREQALDMFKTALSMTRAPDVVLLLVDSEAPLERSGWEHLQSRDGRNRPPSATDQHVFFMVECMEAWILADPDALQHFYDHPRACLQMNQLPAQVPALLGKARVYEALKQMTRNCSSKGPYNKGNHSFKLLELVNPSVVTMKCSEAKRFLDTLRHLMERGTFPP